MTQDHRRLLLHPVHRSLKARFGAFGEWEVPLYYSSVLEEHHTVRHSAGIFDISHMGEIFFEGVGARACIQKIITNNIEKLVDGKAIYSPVCNEQGGIVDDVIVYQLREDRYLIIVNAGNIKKDFAWFLDHAGPDCKIENRSKEFGLLAVQGPQSLDIISRILSEPIGKMAYYSIAPTCSRWDGAWIARTGYTGEYGFELLLRNEDLNSAYAEILEVGRQFNLKPIGFGARDTLRLEAAMLLYGQDMNESTSPLEAGLERFVSFDTDFIGKTALLSEKINGPKRKLVGFELVDSGIARHGYEIKKNGIKIGEVTSGGVSPTLKKNIGLGYIAPSEATVGNLIQISIRQNLSNAVVVKLPFYKREQRS